MSAIETAVTASAAVGAGAAGGVYLAFSAMVSPVLRTRPAAEAVASMQRINEHAVRAPFMTVFFGGAAAASAVLVTELASGPAGSNPARAIGSALALASFVTTVVANVPRNNALARADAGGADAAWKAFDRPWSRANHLRAVFALAGAALLALSGG
ncbi:anthrone oxygenase family protein [Diaminobutyricimonas sp. LJ205]|uniref:anthrone oxygenase family protein n=1 Tax=Diaminobutyricimonas sp. LJ205 TaxID=2683590 RepID=UPI0012F4FDD5|nr:anthrone oxygenase family protein [Diaminobutyricimonas sp. LJ205]